MKHLLKRNKNYYFRYRLSLELKPFFKQSSFFTKSLQTQNLSNAKKNSTILLQKLNYIKQSIKMNLEDNKIIELIKDLTNTLFENTERDLYNIDKVEDTTFALTLEDRIKSIMVPFFCTSKTSFLISPFYDTNGNSFTPLEPKLFEA